MRRNRFDVEPELIPADRILQRWARSVGCGMPNAETYWESRPTELPTDAAIWVDRYVCSRPDRMRKFIHSWYRGQDASAVIAKRFSVGRDEVYALWRACLIVASKSFLDEPCVANLMIHKAEAA